MKKLLSGNEAIARGAYEAGATFASAYPGTPSTEILETVAKEYPEIYAEWSPNEKVAMEVAMGAAFTGARAMVAMKHVGVNVAADPLMTLSYTGICGGLVVVTADDRSRIFKIQKMAWSSGFNKDEASKVSLSRTRAEPGWSNISLNAVVNKLFE